MNFRVAHEKRLNAQGPTSFPVLFRTQKPVPKSEVLKLQPGTWVELKWADAPNSVALLLEKPQRGRGDVSLTLFDPSSKYAPTGCRAVHAQVVRVLGALVVPDHL